MRIASVLSEVWRNLVSGTTRAGLFALLLVAIGLGLAAADGLQIIALERAATAFRDGGGSTFILSADHAISGAACARLGEVDGVAAAGAMRTAADRLQLAALPDTGIPLVEVTPGFPAVLGVTTAGADAVTGLFLSPDLASDLGAHPGTRLHTRDGNEATIAGIFTYPDDGRQQALRYVALEAVPVDQVFDQCWMSVWPPNDQTPRLLATALIPTTSGSSAATGQLNTTFGARFDGMRLFEDRLTRWSPAIAALAGLAVGYTAARIRRLELAAALHAGVRRPALLLQHVLESAAWSLPAGLAGTAVIAVTIRYLEPTDADAVWLVASTPLLTAVAGTLLGAILGTLLTRERHLFRYFKDR